MSNVFAPFGFLPLRNKAMIGGVLNEYQIDPTNTGKFSINDLVKLSGGYVTKAGPTDTPLGTFQGWKFRIRGIAEESMGLGGVSDAAIPFKKSWNGAVTAPPQQQVTCFVDDDPFQTFRVQSFGTVASLDRGKLVDMVDCPAGPDVSIMHRGKQAVSTPVTYYNIDTYTVSVAGSGFTQDQVDLVVNGTIIDMRPSDIVVTAGAIISITPLNKVQGLPTNSPTVTVQAKPGYAGSGATITPNMSGAQTAAQFRIERVIGQPFRTFDSSHNTLGYDLSRAGAFAILEVSYAKHARGSTVAAGS